VNTEADLPAATGLRSLVIPVYKNEGSLSALLEALEHLNTELDNRLEVVFVVDGSPDACFARLHEALPTCRFRSQLCLLSRNFGSFAAIRAGLEHATGESFAVMAADLQEPPELVLDFFRALENEPVDVAIGVRAGRADPILQAITARAYWAVYRRFVQPEMPPGGVDVFGCTRGFRDRLLELTESNSTLVGLVIWLGHRRKLIPYERRPRAGGGRSAWTVRRKLRYLSDSVFAFSDLPLRALINYGAFGMFASLTLAVIVLFAKISGAIPVPGYTAIILAIFFFACLNSFGLGVIGAYVWRTFENTKRRPHSITMLKEQFPSNRT
jgi:glycosyltransferase involved in cell wall biosynthesis